MPVHASSNVQRSNLKQGSNIISKDTGSIMCLDSRHSSDITIICQKSASLISDLAVQVIALFLKPGRPAAVA